MLCNLNSNGDGDLRRVLKRGKIWGGGTLVAYIVHRLRGRAAANSSSVCGV